MGGSGERDSCQVRPDACPGTGAFRGAPHSHKFSSTAWSFGLPTPRLPLTGGPDVQAGRKTKGVGCRSGEGRGGQGRGLVEDRRGASRSWWRTGIG